MNFRLFSMRRTPDLSRMTFTPFFIIISFWGSTPEKKQIKKMLFKSQLRNHCFLAKVGNVDEEVSIHGLYLDFFKGMTR